MTFSFEVPVSTATSAVVDMPTVLSLTAFSPARESSKKSALTILPPRPTSFTSSFAFKATPLKTCDEHKVGQFEDSIVPLKDIRRAKHARINEELDSKLYLVSAVSQYWVLLMCRSCLRFGFVLLSGFKLVCFD